MNKDTTVGELAKKLGNVQIHTLIEKLTLVGVNVSKVTDVVTLEQQSKVLDLLKEPNKISLKRRSVVSHIKVKNSAGGNTTVNVVRKNRRVYLKDDLIKKSLDSLNLISPNVDRLEQEQNNIVEKTIPIDPNLTQQANQGSSSILETNSMIVEKPEMVENNLVVKAPEQQSKVTLDSDKTLLKTSKNKKDKKDKHHENLEEELINKKVKIKSSKTNKDKDANCKINLNLLTKVVTEDLEELEFNADPKTISIRKQKFNNKSVKHNVVIKNLHGFEKPLVPVKYNIELPVGITVAELSQKISVKSSELIKIMMKMGIMATINQVLDQETACLVVEEMGHTAILLNPQQLEDSILIDYNCKLEPRSPIVTVMGHVDHGKTSLLDYIRSTRVTAKEAGGITQHIGAYQVPTKNHGMITFLDTPGHSAFTAMRARGANCTDIIVLVVAADDSVMPQTIEAIQHAKAAEVPIIVAINKIDKPDANLDQVINDLSQQGIMPEEWGGKNIFVKVSAKTGAGIDELLESIALQAEMLELKAPYVGPAQGVILESSLDRSRGGIVATLLIQNGTLNKGDIILAGSEYGKVKNLRNDQGNNIDKAGPSMPVEVLGLSYAPLAGDTFQVVADERKAKGVAELRQNMKKEKILLRQQENKFAGFIDKMQQTDKTKAINIVLKADVQGSVEAISDALNKLSNEQIKINIIGRSVGGFNESDVNLAVASRAFLLGFNVRAEGPAKVLAKTQNKEFNYYSVIYDLINAVKAVIEGSYIVPAKEVIIGIAEVREVFRSSKFGTVAGCLVKEGTIKKGNPIRVLRDNIVIYSGELESLRRFKENLTEVRNGMECGIGVKNYNDIKVKDQIEVFEIVVSKNPKSAVEELKI